ncbi:hypothetical protein [Peribacillus frigoritolerans]|uniref:hypothetical protein n=1 Tax=Peribacillus frigoritolerans TaxID=450367 RepID=UPI003B8AC9F3
MKKKLVLNSVRNKTSQQFFLLKHKVDWKGRTRLLREKRGKGDPRRPAEEAPRPPAESECLKWKSKFYTASKKLWTKGFLSFKTKLIGTEGRDSCGKSVARETPQAQAEEAPRPPAESECLKWKSKFYTASKKLWTKGFLSLKQS